MTVEFSDLDCAMIHHALTEQGFLHESQRAGSEHIASFVRAAAVRYAARWHANEHGHKGLSDRECAMITDALSATDYASTEDRAAAEAIIEKVRTPAIRYAVERAITGEAHYATMVS